MVRHKGMRRPVTVAYGDGRMACLDPKDVRGFGAEQAWSRQKRDYSYRRAIIVVVPYEVAECSEELVMMYVREKADEQIRADFTGKYRYVGA